MTPTHQLQGPGEEGSPTRDTDSPGDLGNVARTPSSPDVFGAGSGREPGDGSRVADDSSLPYGVPAPIVLPGQLRLEVGA